MKVKELIELLQGVNPDADVLVDVAGGSIYPLDAEETEEQNDPTELATCVEYFLISTDWA